MRGKVHRLEAGHAEMDHYHCARVAAVSTHRNPESSIFVKSELNISKLILPAASECKPENFKKVRYF